MLLFPQMGTAALPWYQRRSEDNAVKNINYTDAGLHIMSLRVILRSFVCSQKVILHWVIYISGSGVLSQCNAALLIFTWASLPFRVYLRGSYRNTAWGFSRSYCLISDQLRMLRLPAAAADLKHKSFFCFGCFRWLKWVWATAVVDANYLLRLERLSKHTRYAATFNGCLRLPSIQPRRRR